VIATLAKTSHSDIGADKGTIFQEEEHSKQGENR
jgi:hypothetical protein